MSCKEVKYMKEIKLRERTKRSTQTKVRTEVQCKVTVRVTKLESEDKIILVTGYEAFQTVM
jgi:hypothetical protein